MAKNYLFGDGGLTYEQLQERRKIADAMLSKGIPRNVAEGLYMGGSDIVAALMSKNLDKREDAMRDEFNTEWGAFFGEGGGFGGSGSTSGGYGGSPGSSGGWQAADPSSPKGIANDTMETLVRTGLADRGYDPTMTEGMIMNFKDESGLRTDVNEAAPIVPGSRGGYGLAQWTGPRRTSLEEFAAARGKPASDMSVQLDFLDQELKGPERQAYDAMSGAQTPGDAAIAFLNQFERPAESHRNSRANRYASASPEVMSTSNQPLGMIGGVRGNGQYWQPLDGQGMAHASNPDYADYSQLFREYGTTQQEGWVPVGERDGQAVYAAPDYARDEAGNYMPVSAADAQRLAAERGTMLPTREEVAALYGQAQQIPMPTQPIGETGGPGDPVAYTRALGELPQGVPVAHGKEFFAPNAPTQSAPQQATPAQYAPRGGGQPSADMQTIMRLAQFASNPMASPGQRMVAEAMLSQQMAQMKPSAPDMQWNSDLGRYVDVNDPSIAGLRAPQDNNAPDIETIGGVPMVWDGQQYVEAPVAGGIPNEPPAIQMVDGVPMVWGANGLEVAPGYDSLPGEPEGPDFGAEQGLRKEFLTVGSVKDFAPIRDAFGRIQAAANNPSAAGDLALIFNYMKMLDPGSTVREGEFATAQNATGVPQRVLNTYNNIVTGERLSPPQRADFVSQSGALFNSQASAYNREAEVYRGYADQYGLSPDRIATPVELWAPPPPPEPDPSGSGADAQAPYADPQATLSFLDNLKTTNPEEYERYRQMNVEERKAYIRKSMAVQ